MIETHILVSPFTLTTHYSLFFSVLSIFFCDDRRMSALSTAMAIKADLWAECRRRRGTGNTNDDDVIITGRVLDQMLNPLDIQPDVIADIGQCLMTDGVARKQTVQLLDTLVGL